jgi:hypothetical protein
LNVCIGQGTKLHDDILKSPLFMSEDDDDFATIQAPSVTIQPFISPVHDMLEDDDGPLG